MIGLSVLQRVRTGLASSGPPALNAASLQAALQAALRTPGGPNDPVLDPRNPLEDVRKWKAGFEALRGDGTPLMLRRWLLDPVRAAGVVRADPDGGTSEVATTIPSHGFGPRGWGVRWRGR
eukprot:366025-Chlamydomonas_euryale.AAC.2